MHRKVVVAVKDLVQYIAASLVDNKEAVDVREGAENDAVLIELRVAPEDMGKIIGKQGRIAKALRTVVKAIAAREGKVVLIDILDSAEG